VESDPASKTLPQEVRPILKTRPISQR